MKINASINRLVDKPDCSVKAFASATFDGYYAVHGIKVCEGEKGLFISMPSTSYTNTKNEKKYSDIFHPLTKGARDALSASVINAYNLAVSQSMKSETEVLDSPDNVAGEQTGPETEMAM